MKLPRLLSQVLAGLMLVVAIFALKIPSATGYGAIVGKIAGFKYEFASGDRYYGNTYVDRNSPTYQKYKTGSTWQVTDEHGEQGRYTITGTMNVGDDRIDYIKNFGRVFINIYYDRETENTFSPISSPTEKCELGSEYSYIIKSGVSSYRFGGGRLEADVPFTRYSFKYSYSGGDYYTGWIYCWKMQYPELGYYVGYTQKTIAAGKEVGCYTITAKKFFPEGMGRQPFTDTLYVNGAKLTITPKDGQTFIGEYYDAESRRFYRPSSFGKPVCSYYFDYFQDYIIKDTLSSNGFNTSKPADVSYAVLYSSGGERALDREIFYNRLAYNWKVLTENGFSKDNITVLFGNGTTPGNYIQNNGGKILAATAVNLKATFDKLKEPDQVKVNNILYFISVSHGGRESDPYNKEIKRSFVATGDGGKLYKYDISKLFSGMSPYQYRLIALSQCYAGGMVDGSGYCHYAWSSEDYEMTRSIDNNDTDLDWSKAWIKGFEIMMDQKGLKSSGLNFSRAINSVIEYALKNDYYGPYQDWTDRDNFMANAYQFKFLYPNGDYYLGTVYTPPIEHPNSYRIQIFPNQYYLHQRWQSKTENGELGTYLINGYKAVADDPVKGIDYKYGQVFVDSYYDAETKKTYYPVHRGKAVGDKYLGSESDFIVQENVSEFAFGKGIISGQSVHLEADVGDRYLFRYNYGNGDYYQGYVYRAPGVGYYPGLKLTKKNETGSTGYYQILSMSYTGETARYQQVSVHTYYDAESKKTFTPIRQGTAVGTAYLGSEYDYILKAGVVTYKFGNGYYEADVGDKYLFRYYYSNGDYYQGYVYRAPSATGYYHGQKIIKKNELGLNGYYQILSASWTGETAKYKQIFLDYYKDGESGKGFIPLKKGKAVGTAYLGSEQDYIIKAGVVTYKFGNGYYEADVGDKYVFRYYYTNGDYYQGYVYRAPSATGYYHGQKIIKRNELGLNGYYQILSASWTGERAKYGQVYVTRYTDGDRTTPKPFTPLKSTSFLGNAYLGSEAGYIISTTLAKHYFGKGYYEGDE